MILKNTELAKKICGLVGSQVGSEWSQIPTLKYYLVYPGLQLFLLFDQEPLHLWCTAAMLWVSYKVPLRALWFHHLPALVCDVPGHDCFKPQPAVLSASCERNPYRLLHTHRTTPPVHTEQVSLGKCLNLTNKCSQVHYDSSISVFLEITKLLIKLSWL